MVDLSEKAKVFEVIFKYARYFTVMDKLPEKDGNIHDFFVVPIEVDEKFSIFQFEKKVINRFTEKPVKKGRVERTKQMLALFKESCTETQKPIVLIFQDAHRMGLKVFQAMKTVYENAEQYEIPLAIIFVGDVSQIDQIINQDKGISLRTDHIYIDQEKRVPVKQKRKSDRFPIEKALLQFYWYDDASGIFTPSDRDAWSALYEKFYNIGDSVDYLDDYIAGMLGIIEKEPSFFEAYVEIVSEYLERGSVIEAEAYCQKGIGIALGIIPDNFNGTIPWGVLENRPFLRLHYNYILCQIRQFKYKKAIQLMEQHLAWNPNDNMGVRYLIGEVCLQAGFTKKAEKYLSENQNEYPPAAYSLALLEFKKKNFVNAATALRKGIAQNPYIIEIIMGRDEPTPHLYWHSTTLAAPETAQDYMLNFGYAMWLTIPEAVDFCDWLFNCSDVLKERAVFAAAREGLTYESDFEKRGEYVDRRNQAEISIDNTLSEKLIKKVTDRDGQKKWPWQIKKHQPLGL